MERGEQSTKKKKGERRAKERGDQENTNKEKGPKREMEEGEQSSVEESRWPCSYDGGIYKESPATMATLANIAKRPKRAQQPGSRRTIHDNTSPGYGWLLAGWLAEERIMESGRIYRYYYDPSGRFYRSQEDVLLSWRNDGLICLDL